MAPHLTLVFAVPAAEAGDLPQVAAALAGDVSAFELTFTGLEATPDLVLGGATLALILGTGADRVCALHERAYDGPWCRHFHSDIPFRPHMTLGRLPDLAQAQALQDTLAAGLELPIRGRAEAICLVRRTRYGVETIARKSLPNAH